jgi:hypothetical protein
MSNPSAAEVRITLRIPGKWAHPRELVERLPAGFQISAEALLLPDGASLEIYPAPPDDQFTEIFCSSCRQPPTDDELATVEAYTVNICLSGPGGSLEAAGTIMRAAAAIVAGGGAGVFIDNSALAHGGENWIAMTEDGSPDALSFAFVSIIAGREEVWTMGMHVLGQRDIVMKRADADQDEFSIIDVIRYVCGGEKPIDDGHVLADLSGPRYQAFTQPDQQAPAGSPMHNPFGRLKLVSMRDIAEAN